MFLILKWKTLIIKILKSTDKMQTFRIGDLDKILLIPLEITKLQTKNKRLKIAIWTLIIGGTLITTYLYIKNIQHGRKSIRTTETDEE